MEMCEDPLGVPLDENLEELKTERQQQTKKN